MIDSDHVVLIVDDDQNMCEAIAELLASVGLRSLAFGSVRSYLDYPKPHIPSCIVLDVQLPDLSGLDFQAQIADDAHPPVVFITGHGHIPSSLQVIKQGVVDFLPKPFDAERLVRAVRMGIDEDRRNRFE